LAFGTSLRAAPGVSVVDCRSIERGALWSSGQPHQANHPHRRL